MFRPTAADSAGTLGLAFFKGLSHHEIALHSDIPLGTVKTHIRQGMARMYTLLAKSANLEFSDRS